MSTPGLRIAYFSMEIALDPALPTYSGGLGILAGDTLRSCADLGLSVCGVTLAHRHGYFRQSIDAEGRQVETPDPWHPESRLEELPARVHVGIGDDKVVLRAWLYRVVGADGHQVPVYLLDADLPENAPERRALTDRLYGGDDDYRLAQEAILGIGGVRMLRALGHHQLERFHLNEGHAALAIAELVEEQLAGAQGSDAVLCAVERVRAHCVFTTHTPVPAGHDRFPPQLARAVLGEQHTATLAALGCDDELNMTDLALAGAGFVNGVALRHGEISRGMFPGYPIRSITNGVHAGTWTSPPFQALFDRHLPHWRADPLSLRHAADIAPGEIAAAHAEAKRRLLEIVRERSGRALDPGALTLGFARRSTAYKRSMLVLRDPARLEQIAAQIGPLQLVFSGKAHPRDDDGRRLIREIYEAAQRSGPAVQIVWLSGYDMTLAAAVVAGCDVWLNTPIPPLEASGTSGMKAALNGVPSLSILDGWWLEGCVEGVTGWAIGRDGDAGALSPEARDALHAASLYDKLEHAVAPCFYKQPERFQEIMRQAIALNGSYFNTHRMVLQYVSEAYREPTAPAPQLELRASESA